jgi:RNA recognition motif-containing protein
LKAKGQAFIVFDSVESASNAIDEVNGFELFDKPMVLDFAKTRSDATVLKEGGEDELEAHKRRRLAEKGAFSFSGSSLRKIVVKKNCYAGWSKANGIFLKSVNKLTKLSKPKRSSSVPPALPTPRVRPKPPKEPASSRPAVQQPQSSQTNIFLPTKFCSCGTSPTQRTRRVLQRYLVVSKDSRKSDWCRAERGSRSSNTRTSLVLSARRRPPRECRWGTMASLSGLLTRDNELLCGSFKNCEQLVLALWGFSALLF